MKNIKLRYFITIALVLCMTFSSATTVLAADKTQKEVLSSSIGSPLSSASKYMSSSTGSLTLYLGSTHIFANLHATASGGSGMVTCYVTAPNGRIYNLDSFRADGSYSSNYVEVAFAKAGYYTFNFTNSANESYYVTATIYE